MWVERCINSVCLQGGLTLAVHLCQVSIYIKLDLFFPTATVISRGTFDIHPLMTFDCLLSGRCHCTHPIPPVFP